MRVSINLSIYGIIFIVLNIGLGCRKESESNDKQPPVSVIKTDQHANDLSITISFIKDNQQSLAEALDKATKLVREKYEAPFTRIVTKMKIGIDTIENLRFIALTSDKFVQPIQLIFRNQGHDPDGKEHAYNIALFTVDLVWPGITREELQSRPIGWNVSAFPNANTQNQPLIQWTFQIDFEKLLTNLFSRQEYYYLSLIESRERLKNSFYKIPLPITAGNLCKNVEPALTEFIKEEFSDLGKVKNISCSDLRKKKERSKEEADFLKGTSFEYDTFVAINFTVGDKILSIEEPTSNVIGIFYQIIKKLLFLRYEAISGGSP